MLTGPEVRGSRPVLVNFASWKDREEVMAKSKLLRGTNIYVTEDLSRKIREHRNELNKFMREVSTVDYRWIPLISPLCVTARSVPNPRTSGAPYGMTSCTSRTLHTSTTLNKEWLSVTLHRNR